MREIYEKYYTVRLYSCPDLHFAPSIIDIPGEYDTEEEARAAAEPEFQKTVSYNDRGESYSWFEVQVIDHYKKLSRCFRENPVHYITLVGKDGKKIECYIDESRQLIFTTYATVEFMNHIGFKVVKEED